MIAANGADEPKRKHRRVRSFGGLLSSLTSVVSSIDLSGLQAPGGISPTKLAQSVDVHNLDICSLASTRSALLSLGKNLEARQVCGW